MGNSPRCPTDPPPPHSSTTTRLFSHPFVGAVVRASVMLSAGGVKGVSLSVSSHTTKIGRGPSVGLVIPTLLPRCPIRVGRGVGSSSAKTSVKPSVSAAMCTAVTSDVLCLVHSIRAFSPSVRGDKEEKKRNIYIPCIFYKKLYMYTEYSIYFTKTKAGGEGAREYVWWKDQIWNILCRVNITLYHRNAGGFSGIYPGHTPKPFHWRNSKMTL